MTVKSIFKSMEYGPAPESPDTVNNWLKAHKSKFELYIGGKWERPLSRKYFDSINPCNKNFLAKIPWSNEKDVDKAVQAARKAFPKWSTEAPHVRARYLYAIARQIQKHSRLFAVLESLGQW